MAGARIFNGKALQAIKNNDYTRFLSQVENGIFYPHFFNFLSEVKPVGLLVEDSKVFHILAEKGKLSLLVDFLFDDEKWVKAYKQEFGVVTTKENLLNKLKLLSGIIAKDAQGKTPLQKSIEHGDGFDLKNIFEIFLRTEDFKLVYDSVLIGLEDYVAKSTEDTYDEASKKMFNQLVGMLKDEKIWPAIYYRIKDVKPKESADRDELLTPFLKEIGDDHTILSKTIELGVATNLFDILDITSYEKQGAVIESIWKGVSARAKNLASKHNKSVAEIINDSQFEKLRAEFTKVVEAKHTSFLEGEIGAFQRLITFATCHSNEFWGMNTDSFLKAFNIETFVVKGQKIGKMELRNAIYNASTFAGKNLTLQNGKTTNLNELEKDANKALKEFKERKYRKKDSNEEFSIASLEEEYRAKASGLDELDELFAKEYETEDGKKLSLEKMVEEYDKLSNKLIKETKHVILGEEKPLSISEIKAKELFLKSNVNGYFRDMMINLLARKSIEKGTPIKKKIKKDGKEHVEVENQVKITDLLPKLEDESLASKLKSFVTLGLFEEKENGSSPTERVAPKVTFAESDEVGAAASHPVHAPSRGDKENIRNPQNPPSSSTNALHGKPLPLIDSDPALIAREIINIITENRSAMKQVTVKFGREFAKSLLKSTKIGGDEYIAAALVFLADINGDFLGGSIKADGTEVSSHIDKAAKRMNMKTMSLEDFTSEYVKTWNKSWALKNFGSAEGAINLWDIISAHAKTPIVMKEVYKWYVGNEYFTKDTATSLLKTPVHKGCAEALKFIKEQNLLGEKFWDNVFLEFVRRPQDVVAKMYLEDANAKILNSVTNREKISSGEDIYYIFATHALVLMGDILQDLQMNVKTNDTIGLKESRKDLNTLLDFLMHLESSQKLYLPEYDDTNSMIVTRLLQWVGSIDKMLKNANSIFKKIPSFMDEGQEWSKIIQVNGQIIECYKDVPPDKIDIDQRTLLSYISYQAYKPKSTDEVESLGCVTDPTSDDTV